MKNEQIEFLQQLIETPTPTGSEEPGMLLLGRRIKEKTGIQPTIDIHGNLHAVLDVGAKDTVMIEGHCDEIGYIVSYIDDRGFVYLQALGGIVAPLTAAERLTILSKNGPVNGVVGSRPPHLSKDKTLPDSLKDLPCDIGASSKAEAEALISIGDSAVVDSGFRKLAGTRASGRAFDDRIGAFAMAEAFINLATGEKKPKMNVHYVASVCEEIGLVGGRLASYAVHPTIGISCDVSFAVGPSADDVKTIGDMRLGAGAMLAIGPIYHKGLVNHFRKTAAEGNITMQEHVVSKGAGNNGWAMKLERGGVAVVQIAVPLRYMHSPVEVLDLNDVKAVIDLTTAGILGLEDGMNLLPQQP